LSGIHFADAVAASAIFLNFARRDCCDGCWFCVEEIVRIVGPRRTAVKPSIADLALRSLKKNVTTGSFFVLFVPSWLIFGGGKTRRIEKFPA